MILRSLLSVSLAIGFIVTFSSKARAQFESCQSCDTASAQAMGFGHLLKSNDCCGNWYVGGFGGWVGQTEASFSGESSGFFFDDDDGILDEEFSSDAGFGIGAVLGRRFNNGFRLEGDFIFRHQSLDDINDLDLDDDDVIASADVSTFALNWNIAYDFTRGKKFNPYVGVGTGLYLVGFDATGTGDEEGSESSVAFPWANLQWFAGVSSPINDRAEWFVEYRGLTTYGIDADFSDPGDGEEGFFRASTYHSSIFSGIRVTLR